MRVRGTHVGAAAATVDVAEEMFNRRKTPRRAETGRLLPGVINCQTSDTPLMHRPRGHYNALAFMRRLRLA